MWRAAGLIVRSKVHVTAAVLHRRSGPLARKESCGCARLGSQARFLRWGRADSGCRRLCNARPTPLTEEWVRACRPA